MCDPPGVLHEVLALADPEISRLVYVIVTVLWIPGAWRLGWAFVEAMRENTAAKRDDTASRREQTTALLLIHGRELPSTPPQLPPKKGSAR